MSRVTSDLFPPGSGCLRPENLSETALHAHGPPPGMAHGASSSSTQQPQPSAITGKEAGPTVAGSGLVEPVSRELGYGATTKKGGRTAKQLAAAAAAALQASRVVITAGESLWQPFHVGL